MTDSTRLNPSQEITLGRDFMTLSQHVLSQCGTFSPDAYDLSALMGRIGLAGKTIARHLSRAGLMENV
ncbi:MAG: class 1 fructose-bisphosphatase, partial [Pseudanabaena sp.]